MLAARGLAGLMTAMVSLSGCGNGSSAPACDALVRVARQSAACEAALEPLAAAVEKQRDELACRLAVRRVLEGPQPAPVRVRSVWTADSQPDASPLTAQELASFTESARPAQLLVTPDIAPAPGVPPTSAQLDEMALDPDEEGRLHGHLAPGVATLILRHAGRRSVYCIELRPCETLRVTSHGDKLARHPDVSAGPC
jgi:hypothetical protein